MVAGGENPHFRSKNKMDVIRLFLASFLALFVELTLIRFIPGHVRVVGYFTNIVLIASFFGLGLGFLLAHRRFRLEIFILPILLLVVVLVWQSSGIAVADTFKAEEYFWLSNNREYVAPSLTLDIKLPISIIVLLNYTAVALALVPIGQIMGRLFGRFKRLKAYALDLGGSLTGVVFFGLLSWLHTPPWLWFSIAILITVLFLAQGWRERGVSLTAGILLLLMLSLVSQGDEIWSPYYKVRLFNFGPEQIITTNDTLHQIMLDFDNQNPNIQKTRQRFEIPYRLASSLKDVLIVGAGSGNDIAIARSMGARNIDAVEIDGVFSGLGRENHVQKPYRDDGLVKLFIQDARAYFKQCHKKYDLIVFGTLDSQALLSGLSSVRLDNYIYTKESFKEAYRLLKPGGLLAVFHMSAKSYISGRIILLLASASGRIPQVHFFKDHTLFNYIFVQGDDPNFKPAFLPPASQKFLADLEIPSDDWPFLFLHHRSIPRHYLEVLLGVFLLAAISVGLALRGKFRFFDLRMFLIGAGFLLLETKSVTQMSLLFGSTWVVNLLVFSSILAMLLAANLWIFKRSPRLKTLDIRPVFVGLVFSLLVLAYVPVSWISGLPVFFQWLFGGLIVGVPIILAGLIFPVLFNQALDSQAAFASNLLGAVLGGIVEYTGLVFGLGALSLLAALFYLTAFALCYKRLA